MNRCAVGLVALVAACLGVSSVAHAAAALENGAKTSAKATAKDPAKKQIQIAADPVGITDFQFTLHYDPLILHVADDDAGVPEIRALNGYVLGTRPPPQVPSLTIAGGGGGEDATATPPSYAIDPTLGLVTVRGYWPVSNGEVPYDELNVYDVTFELNDEWLPGVPLDPETPFIVYSLGVTGASNPFGGNSPDRLVAGNIVNGQVVVSRTYTAGDPDNPILPANTGLLVIGTETDGLPEPAVAGMLVPGALLLGRRKR